MNLVENVDHYTSSCGYCSCGDSAAMVSPDNVCGLALKPMKLIDILEPVLRDCFVMIMTSCATSTASPGLASQRLSYTVLSYCRAKNFEVFVSSGHVGAQAELRGIPGPAGPRVEAQRAVGVSTSA